MTPLENKKKQGKPVERLGRKAMGLKLQTKPTVARLLNNRHIVKTAGKHLAVV